MYRHIGLKFSNKLMWEIDHLCAESMFNGKCSKQWS